MERLTERMTENIIELSAKANPSQYKNCPQMVHIKHPFWNVFNRLCDYEDAEEQGLLQRIECRCKDCVHWSDKVAGATEHVKLCTVGGYMVGKNGYCVYAEKRVE